MKVLMTGITGFIGRHLAEMWKERADIALTGIARTAPAAGLLPAGLVFMQADITDAAAVESAIAAVQPDVVIHSAAMSKPNDCELQRELCFEINVAATQHVVDACKKHACRLVFMSTDMVFGDAGGYKEDDTVCPVNYYGESKVLAEQIVAASGLDYAIVRTVLVYGSKLPGQNGTFLQWVHGNISQQNIIRVFTDQQRTTTYVHDLCRGIELIIDQKASGIFHICGAEVFTPFEIAQAVAEYCGFDEKLILPITSEDMQEAARRPAASTLNIDKAKAILGYEPTPLSVAVQHIFGRKVQAE